MWDVFTVQGGKTVSISEPSNSKQRTATKLIAKDAAAGNTSATYANIPANAKHFYFIISF